MEFYHPLPCEAQRGNMFLVPISGGVQGSLAYSFRFHIHTLDSKTRLFSNMCGYIQYVPGSILHVQYSTTGSTLKSILSRGVADKTYIFHVH